MFEKICNWIDYSIRILTMIILFLIFVIVFGSAVLRYLFELNILSSYDWARVLFIWFCYFGMTIVYKQRDHSKFVFIEQKLRGIIKTTNNTVIHLISLFFFIVVAYTGTSLSYTTRGQKLPASGIGAMWLYIPIALSSAIAVIYTIYRLCEDFGICKSKVESSN